MKSIDALAVSLALYLVRAGETRLPSISDLSVTSIFGICLLHACQHTTISAEYVMPRLALNHDVAPLSRRSIRHARTTEYEVNYILRVHRRDTGLSMNICAFKQDILATFPSPAWLVTRPMLRDSGMIRPTCTKKSVKSLYSTQLPLPPSCVTFSPERPEYFVVGTYYLEREEGEDAATGDGASEPKGQAQSRSGSLILFRVGDGEV